MLGDHGACEVLCEVCEPPTPAEHVIARLEEAGLTLLSMPLSGYSTALQTSRHEVVREMIEAYGYTEATVRPLRPAPDQISRMDEAMIWIHLIPITRYVLRRIVGARCLVSPLTDKHLYPWRRVARAVGADYRAVQRWHAEAIDMIVAELRRRNFIFPS